MTICGKDAVGAFICCVCSAIIELNAPCTLVAVANIFFISRRIPSVCAVQSEEISELVAKAEIPDVLSVFILIFAFGP